jgi:hypothetical protein
MLRNFIYIVVIKYLKIKRKELIMKRLIVLMIGLLFTVATYSQIEKMVFMLTLMVVYLMVLILNYTKMDQLRNALI